MSSSLDMLNVKCLWNIQVVMFRRSEPVSVKYGSEIPTVGVGLGMVSIGWYLRPKS